MIIDRLRWKLKNKAINIIVNNGGMVFGGAVRDKYLHDVHATAFFEHVRTLTSETLDELGKTRAELYQDDSYMPELKGRFVSPNDIDAYIHIADQTKLLSAIKVEFPCCTKLFERDIKQYFPNLTVEPDTIMHHRYALRTMRTTEMANWLSKFTRMVPYEIRTELKEFIVKLRTRTRDISYLGRYPVYLDLMVYVKPYDSTMPDPPFGSLDFMCNALILDKSGFRLSKHIEMSDPLARLKAMTGIMNEIEEKKATVVNIAWYRVRKMLRKGWKVAGIFHHIEQVEESEYDGHCLICHGRLNEIDPDVFDVIPHMKLKCCDARYHPLCMLKAIDTGEHSMRVRTACAMCNQPLPDITSDGDNLAGYLDNRIHLM